MSLIQVRGIMDRLAKKLDRPQGISKISNRLAWPLWGKEDIYEGLYAIERFKTVASTCMILGIWDFTQEMPQYLQRLSLDQMDHHERNATSTLEFAVAGNQERNQHSSERDRIIEWFSPLNFFPRQADVLRSREPGTGEWVLQDNLIKHWKSKAGKTVWCRGIPGAGKTVLASVIVEDLRTDLDYSDAGVAVIYLNHKESDSQLPDSLLAAIWRQLVFQKPYSSSMRELYDGHRERQTEPSLNEICAVLRLTISELSRIFIVVDALDEYPEDLRDVLIEHLVALGPTVNLMIFSRLDIYLDRTIPELGILEVLANEDDIRRYIDGQICKSPRLANNIKKSPSLRGEIERTIVSRSDGMFLLAKLHIESIVKQHTVKAIREALKNMPGDLKRAYDELWERINRQSEEDRNLARRVLAWILNAETLLLLSELVEALAIEPKSTELDPDNILDPNIITSVCAGLVVINEEDNLVRLVHYTAQDYLEEIQDEEFPDAQIEIARTCFTYLSFHKFGQGDDIDLQTTFNENAPLEYALLFGLIHARGDPEHRIISDILSLLSCLAPSTGESEIRWQRMASVHASLPRTRLGIAAYFGLLHVAQRLVDEDGFDIGALRGATTNGHTEMVRLLMKSQGYREHVEAQKASTARRFPLKTPSDDERTQSATHNITSLQRASLQGDEEAVYMLLESGVNINEETRPYGTALHAAAACGHLPVVCILLAHGANVNAEVPPYGAPLRVASLGGHTDIVLLLLENGAQINARAQDGSALAAALSRGRKEVAQLLIDHGANVNDTGTPGWSVLARAAENKNCTTAENHVCSNI
ncbi:hypothetical protein R3P38DRAFT_3262743 [Favolaschia claudopus]|uniref:NACHT domain-containing protein n=1 Tax=Favolaschia claudopus TaxID=2862362 RepID=A0AAW0CH59_9AGAR